LKRAEDRAAAGGGLRRVVRARRVHPFISATVELALDKHYATAAAAGTAASFFYVGGIINGVDLARHRNHIAQQPYADRLEQLLVPELSGGAAAPGP
jgi:hypothetical protein